MRLELLEKKDYIDKLQDSIRQAFQEPSIRKSLKLRGIDLIVKLIITIQWLIYDPRCFWLTKMKYQNRS